MSTREYSQNHETHHGTVLLHSLAAVFWVTYGASMAVETMAHDWEFDRFDDGSQSEYNRSDLLQKWLANISQPYNTIEC